MLRVTIIHEMFRISILDYANSRRPMRKWNIVSSIFAWDDNTS